MSGVSDPSNSPSAWYVFDGEGTPEERLARLPPPPPWRDFKNRRRGEHYELTKLERDAVNAALYLRRPLLVTGPPGSGKSTLAYAVAKNLGLGEVLRWPINSRSTLTEGLYSYDAIARLRDAEFASRSKDQATANKSEQIGRYIRLNALGTALYGTYGLGEKSKPRVLLIDEIDKSDIDLPNDLLHVFEEGEFEIPELARFAGDGQAEWVEVETADPVPEGVPRKCVRVRRGVVRCDAFPFVLLTSNKERELPPAFFRRCLRLDLPETSEADHLRKVIAAHLQNVDAGLVDLLISEYMRKQQAHALVANDQLLNAVHLILEGKVAEKEQRDALIAIVLRELNR